MRSPACWRCWHRSRTHAGSEDARFTVVFMLAVAVACVLAGAESFREMGDHAADLPQEVVARLGGKPHPLRREIIAPSEKRIRIVIQDLDAQQLDELTGNWLRELADVISLDAGRASAPRRWRVIQRQPTARPASSRRKRQPCPLRAR